MSHLGFNAEKRHSLEVKKNVKKFINRALDECCYASGEDKTFLQTTENHFKIFD